MTCLISFKSTLIIILLRWEWNKGTREISFQCRVQFGIINITLAASHAVCTNRKEMTGN
jgi:hypothetical protein